jgi:hypothetical protein
MRPFTIVSRNSYSRHEATPKSKKSGLKFQPLASVPSLSHQFKTAQEEAGEVTIGKNRDG